METSSIGHGLQALTIGVCGLAAITGRRRHLRAAALAAVCATMLLGVAFVTNDFRFRAVAEFSQRASAGPYRLSGLWAGTAPSLLLWAAMALALAAIGAKAASSVRAGAFIGGWLFLASALAADPFERLGLAPIDGGGLVPVLRHPAMLVHPPLLYLGMLATVPAFGSAVADDWPAARRWLAVTVGVLTAALGIGSWWAYAEQGWGGFWAWDPVENGGLLVWLAAVGALHLPAGTAPRWRRVCAMSPLVLASAATWLTRSGMASSVHAFAEARAVGWWTAGLTLLILGGTVWYGVRATTATGSGRPGRLVTLNLITVGAALVVVAAGTFAPVALRMAGEAPSSVQPSFYTSMLRPVALLAAAGATFAAVWRRGGRRSWPQVLAHGGFVVLLVGVGGTGLGGHASVVISPGDTTEVLGRSFSYGGLVGETTAEADIVVAQVTVDGVALRPSLSTFAANGQLLAETDTSRRWWGDVQVVLTRRVAGGAAAFDVHVAPLQSLVWVGALLITMGSMGSVGSIRSRRAAGNVRERRASVGAVVPASTVPPADLQLPPDHPSGPPLPDPTDLPDLPKPAVRKRR